MQGPAQDVAVMNGQAGTPRVVTINKALCFDLPLPQMPIHALVPCWIP